jgi:hypothetical protein
VLSISPHPSQILLAPFFPLGLLAALPHGEDRAINGWMQIYPALLGWLFYGLISAALFKARGKQSFFLTYILFCIILLLNVAGCKKVLEAAAGIH